MKRRYRDASKRGKALQRVVDFLVEDLRQTIAIKGFSRGYLYNYMRLKASVLVSKNRLYDHYKT